MLLSGVSPGLLIDWKDTKKADWKFGHAAFARNMDIIWIGVMSLSKTDTFVYNRIYCDRHMQ